MELIFERAELRRACAALAEIVKGPGTIPLLECVLLDTMGDKPGRRQVRVMGTDMDRWLDLSFPAEVIAGGAVCVPAGRLKAVADAAAEGAQLRLKLGSNRMSITAGRGRYSLPTLPATDYPMAKVVDAPPFEIEGTALRRLLDRCSHAMSIDTTRYYICAVYLHGERDAAGTDILVAVATDGHRMVRDAVPHADAALHFGPRDNGTLLGDATVNAIRRLFAETPTLTIRRTESLISLGAGDPPRDNASDNALPMTFVSRLVDGTFPQYGRVIPDAGPLSVGVDRAGLESLVARLAPLCARSVEEKRPLTSMLIEVTANADGGGILVASGGAAERGIARDEMAVDYAGDPVAIGLNARYLLDACKALGGERLTLYPNRDNGPIRVETDAAPEVVEILMPMRVHVPTLPE